ncbi:MAG: DUF2490 domain-containing protein [Bacteroidota bacterium]
MNIRLWCLALISSLAIANAQDTSEDHVGSWYTYNSNHRFTELLSASAGMQFRYYEMTSNHNLSFIYSQINYHQDTNHNYGLGYAFLSIDRVFEFEGTPNVTEHRTYEQYRFKHKLHRFKVNHRLRLEQRFLDLNGNNDFQQRLRYRIGFTYTINSFLFAELKEEPFINFQNQAFHENRFYVGSGFNITKLSTVKIGYLKQHINKRNLNRLMISINISTDSRKKTSNSVAKL